MNHDLTPAQARRPRALGMVRAGLPRALSVPALVVLVMLAVLVANAGATYSAFSATTGNANSAGAGSVVLSDNDGGVAMLALSSAMPNDTDTACIKVTYSGSVAATVHAYGSISGSLAQYLTLKVTRGTDSSPSYDSCTNFSADATDYSGLGPGVLYNGNLSAFPASYAAGLVDPSSTTAIETWTTSEAHSYKFQVTLQNNTSAQGLTGSASFTWEARNTVTGYLTQLDGTMGCISETGDSGACVNGSLLDEAIDVAMSPDGASLYAIARTSDSVLSFSRDTNTGRLTQLSGTNGCMTETGNSGACVDGKGLDRPHSLEVSPDGKNVYVASWNSNAVAVLDRNTSTGVLSQSATTTGCTSETGTSGACVDGYGLTQPVAVTVSPDGTSVYVATYGTSGVAVFSRNTGTGVLTQLAGTSGCVSETGTSGACTDGLGLSSALAVAVSSDGANVYVASDGYDGVAVFSRNTGTGALTQLGGTSACVTETGSSGSCTDGLAISGAYNIAISADGRFVYVSAYRSSGVASFSRNTSTGALTQLSGTNACLTDSGTSGSCIDGKGLSGPREIALSPDGESIYVAVDSGGGLAVLTRDTFSGRLTQTGTSSACLNVNGSGGCGTAKDLSGATGIAVDPTGAFVYAATYLSKAVTVFRRAT